MSQAIGRRVVVAIFIGTVLSSLVAQDTGGWRRPPEPIASLVDAEPTPGVSLSPCGRFLLLTTREAMPSIAVMARPYEKLAGLRVDPRTRTGQLSVETKSIVLRSVATGEDRSIPLPPGHVTGASWSDDGERIAFTRASDTGLELWIAKSLDASVKKIDGVALNGVLGAPVQWMPDQKTVLCKLAMTDDPPPRPAAPGGPAVQESGGGAKAQIRTNPDMLQNEADVALFTFLAVSRLAFVDADTGGLTPTGEADLIASAEPSPDGKYLLVERIRKPFSYLVPWSSFPSTTEIRDRAGQVVRTVVNTPLAENVPIGGVVDGVRGVSWLPLPGAVISWIEAKDGGDPKKKVEFRDEIFVLADPAAKPVSWFKTQHRASGVMVGEDGRTVIAAEFDRDTKRQRAWRLDMKDLAVAPAVIYERSSQDAYGDPGRPVMRRMKDGRTVVRMKDGRMYRSGQGSSPKGDRPFLDLWNPVDNKSERIWQAAEGRFEMFNGFLDADGAQLLVRTESPTEPPKDVALTTSDGAKRTLTDFGDPALAYTSKIKKELIRYKREDGVDLSGTLYLPPDYQTGTKLPVFVWAYPLEYAQASDAAQVRAQPTRYVRLAGASHLWLLLAGYAVLDDAAMPIVGPPKSANDTFVQQIKWNAEAAAKALIDQGVGDPARLAVGGHSYGAFMTANLLCHTDVFATGVARSGAYNRTLTPFGFQNEERTYWEAPEIYNTMSPFANAHKCNEPLLLVHGEDDNNQGTFPIQSQRFYHALKGHGRTARLVMLPHESHGYRARESNQHVLAETIAWLDKHLKNRVGP